MMLPILRRFGGLLLGAALAGCGSGDSETLLSGDVQGTTYHIKMVLGGLQVDQAELKQAVDAVYSDIDLKLSNYRADSEISRINREAGTDWLAVSPEIAELVDIARQVHDKTEGCYDLTIKPLFDLWGFSRHQNRVPTDAEIAANRLVIDGASAIAMPEAHEVMERAAEMIAGGADRMKLAAQRVPLVAVGGGAFAVPDELAGISAVIRPDHGDVANAVGAALAQVSGEVDQVFRNLGRETAIAKATEIATDRALGSGADAASIEVIEVEDLPLAYLPGDARRVRVRVVGNLAG
jgi:hypothetical protein